MSTLAKALSHPILQGIGAVAAVLALILPAFLALGPRSPDGVSVIHAETVHLSKMIPMFQFESRTENGVKIVENVVIAFFFIRNDTKNAIRPSDFIEPLGISLKDNARVIDVQSCDRTYRYLTVDYKPVRQRWPRSLGQILLFL